MLAKPLVKDKADLPVQPLSQLTEQLGWHDTPKIIALAGAGGKTSLMHRLGHELYQKGKRVLLTTTTKIYRPCRHKCTDLPADYQLVTDKSNTSLLGQLSQERLFDKPANQSDKSSTGQLVVAGLEPIEGSLAAMHNKLCGICQALPAKLIEQDLFDVVIVEADGAARKPLKAPSDQEPVIPDGTDLVIGLSGWEGLSQPVSHDSVHRLEQFCQLTGLVPDAEITANALEKLILSPAGLFRNRPPKAGCCWLINQADDEQQLQQAHKLAQTIAIRANDYGADWLSAILAGSLQRDQLLMI